jgi:hypothetical protein
MWFLLNVWILVADTSKWAWNYLFAPDESNLMESMQSFPAGGFTTWRLSVHKAFPLKSSLLCQDLLLESLFAQKLLPAASSGK